MWIIPFILLKDLNFNPHFNQLVDYIDTPIQTPPNFGFLTKMLLEPPNNLTL